MSGMPAQIGDPTRRRSVVHEAKEMCDDDSLDLTCLRGRLEHGQIQNRCVLGLYVDERRRCAADTSRPPAG